MMGLFHINSPFFNNKALLQHEHTTKAL